MEKSISQGIASGTKTGDDNRLRMAKSRQKKLDERWGLEKNAKGGRFKLNRDLGGYHLTARGDIQVEDYDPKVKITLPAPEKLRTLGDLVHLDKVSFKYPGAKKCLLEGVSFTVQQGGRCVLVGANGQGKSTLAKLILGELSPTKGTIVRHPLLKIGYFSQHAVEELSAVSDNITALAHFVDHFSSKGNKVSEGEAMACLGTFGLGGRISSEMPLKMLSGGQKVRLAFALIVFHPPPLLLLDELTTHVDAPTIQGLARALRSYPGGILLVTHDRWFSRVVVEGHSLHSVGAFGDAFADADDEITSSSSEDDVTADARTGKGKGPRLGGLGQTFHVGGGRMMLLEGGMTQYIKIVERKLKKRLNPR